MPGKDGLSCSGASVSLQGAPSRCPGPSHFFLPEPWSQLGLRGGVSARPGSTVGLRSLLLGICRKCPWLRDGLREALGFQAPVQRWGAGAHPLTLLPPSAARDPPHPGCPRPPGICPPGICPRHGPSCSLPPSLRPTSCTPSYCYPNNFTPSPPPSLAPTSLLSTGLTPCAEVISPTCLWSPPGARPLHTVCQSRAPRTPLAQLSSCDNVCVGDAHATECFPRCPPRSGPKGTRAGRMR